MVWRQSNICKFTPEEGATQLPPLGVSLHVLFTVYDTKLTATTTTTTTTNNNNNNVRVKSGNFGHQVNSDTYLQTVLIQMRRLLMSHLIRIFTVCLVNLFIIPIFEIWSKQGRCPKLAVCPNIPDFTLTLMFHLQAHVTVSDRSLHWWYY